MREITMRYMFVGLVLAAVLQGCGLKGPLYLPEDKPADAVQKPAGGAKAPSVPPQDAK